MPYVPMAWPYWSEEKSRIREAAASLQASLGNRIRLHADLREEMSPGYKFNEWELKGVPLRLEMGPRDLAKGQVMAVSRLDRRKEALPLDGLETRVPDLLSVIQKGIYDRALKFRQDNTRPAGSYEEFKEQIESLGGFFEALWCGDSRCEAKIKEETKATIRVVPMGDPVEAECVYTGEKGREVVFAQAY